VIAQFAQMLSNAGGLLYIAAITLSIYSAFQWLVCTRYSA
jgi:hypothetical protein